MEQTDFMFWQHSAEKDSFVEYWHKLWDISLHEELLEKSASHWVNNIIVLIQRKNEILYEFIVHRRFLLFWLA